MTDYEWSEPVEVRTPGRLGLGWPGLIIEADYTSGPLSLPHDWHGLLPVRSVSISTGRQRLLDRTEVGQAVVTLDNRGRQFDPIVHPQVRPSNHLRIRADLDGIFIDLFRGFVRSWPQEWPGRVDAVSRVQVEDAFSLMARFEMQGESIAEMQSGEHIREVLTMYGWPEAGTVPEGTDWWVLEDAGSLLGTNTYLGESLSQIDDGVEEIMALDLEGNLLDHLLNVAETTEGGTFYIGPSGDVVFRQHRFGGEVPIGTWGDGTGENKYTDLVITFDDSQLYNHIWFNRRGSPTPTSATVVDDVSVAMYGPRSLVQHDLLHSTDAAAEARAETALTKYSQATLYPQRLTMRPKPDSPLWPIILGTPLGTTILVRRRPPGGGDLIELSCYIIGVEYEITPEIWDITWNLAEAPRFLDSWLLGVVGRSELGVTTALGAGLGFGGVIGAPISVDATADIVAAGRNLIWMKSAALSATATIAVAGAPPFVPTDISGIQGWYDFSTVTTHLYQDAARTTIITADAQTIGGVTDKSGAGHHLTTDNTVWEPAYKTGIINGKSVARFDGSDDYMYADTFTNDATQTFFIVSKKRSAPTGSTQGLIGMDSGADVYTNSGTSATGYVYDVNSVGAARVLGGTATNTNVIALRYNSTSSLDYWINGGAKVNFDPGNAYSVTPEMYLGQHVGTGSKGDFDIGEVIRYDTALSLTDVNRVGPYLAAKWGFTWTTAT